ncbi:hypothetical protein Tco_0491311 [Tanacetum coccineum]
MISYHNTRELHIKRFHLGRQALSFQNIYYNLPTQVIEQVAARSGMDSKMVELLSFKLDVLDFGTCLYKMYLKYHEKQVEDILNYLDELYLQPIRENGEGHNNGNELKTELKKSVFRLQIQKKRIGKRIRLPLLTTEFQFWNWIIEKTQAYHQTDQEDL